MNDSFFVYLLSSFESSSTQTEGLRLIYSFVASTDELQGALIPAYHGYHKKPEEIFLIDKQAKREVLHQLHFYLLLPVAQNLYRSQYAELKKKCVGIKSHIHWSEASVTLGSV